MHLLEGYIYWWNFIWESDIIYKYYTNVSLTDAGVAAAITHLAPRRLGDVWIDQGTLLPGVEARDDGACW